MTQPTTSVPTTSRTRRAGAAIARVVDDCRYAGRRSFELRTGVRL